MRLSSLSVFAFALLAVLTPRYADAAVPADRLMPATSTGFLVTDDLQRLTADFDKTQIGQLLADPVMKPFAEDLQRQIRAKWEKTNEPLGLKWEDLKGVPSGEVAAARIKRSSTSVAVAMVADVTGHLPQVTELLAKVDANLKARKATLAVREVAGVSIKIYTHTQGDDKGKQAVFFVEPNHNQLVVTDNLIEAKAILGRFARDKKDHLAGVEAYQATMERCVKAQGDAAPHVRWFVDPFAFADAQRIADPSRIKRKGTDMLQVLKNQGFDAIKGVGGLVTFVDGAHDILHRTNIYAPAVARRAGDPNQDRYNLAMRMLNFPNGGSHAPPAWVPRDLATFISVNADLINGFEYSKTLVNELADDEIFEDVLRSLKEDPNGPQVDVRKEVVANLGQHVMVMSDYQLPITPKSERLLFAIELSDVAPVRKAVNKTMENDPNARKLRLGRNIIWEIIEEQHDVDGPVVDLGGFNEFEFEDEEEEDDVKRALPTSAVTVAHGHLIVGSHVDFLKKVLMDLDRRKTLTGSIDYQIIQTTMKKLGATHDCAQLFSRTDEAFRSTYELIKQGKMPQSETLMGKLLNSMLGDGDDEKVREQEIDGTKLPEYQMVRRYLGPAGMFVVSHDDGWLATGCFLSKELKIALKPAAAQKADAPAKEKPAE